MPFPESPGSSRPVSNLRGEKGQTQRDTGGSASPFGVGWKPRPLPEGYLSGQLPVAWDVPWFDVVLRSEFSRRE